MAAVDRDFVTVAPAAGEKLMVADCKAMAFESTVDVPTKLGLRMCSFREKKTRDSVVRGICNMSMLVYSNPYRFRVGERTHYIGTIGAPMQHGHLALSTY
jgi:hypothetical protein